MMKISLPWRSISRYMFASLVMGITLFLLPHPNTKLMTLSMTAVGGVIYLALLATIDKEARALPKAFLREILGKKKYLNPKMKLQ
jgi:hypothetical protein